ncbi:hypothetical protein FO519_003576 [Halicephalobus sp. NKZ332]|nr:hypothetical protein FO519_003576 [Halicephalobus sp. NKZ332]
METSVLIDSLDSPGCVEPRPDRNRFLKPRVASKRIRNRLVQKYGICNISLVNVPKQHRKYFRYPTDACPLVVMTMCIQFMLGVICQALMAGVIFAKLARPIKRAATILFSKNAVICLRDNKLCLCFRVGDLRKSVLAEAHVRLQMIKKCVTLEGEILPFHQFDMSVGYDSGLDRVFVVWPITICHEINEESPLYEISKGSLNIARFEIIALLEGVVESVGSTTQARTSYLPNEILWGKRFARLVTYQRENGQYKIDLAKFHDVKDVETPSCSAKELDEIQSSMNTSMEMGPDISVNLASKEGSEIEFEGERNNLRQRSNIPDRPDNDSEDSETQEQLRLCQPKSSFHKKSSVLSAADSEVKRKQSIQALKCKCTQSSWKTTCEKGVCEVPDGGSACLMLDHPISGRHYACSQSPARQPDCIEKTTKSGAKVKVCSCDSSDFCNFQLWPSEISEPTPSSNTIRDGRRELQTANTAPATRLELRFGPSLRGRFDKESH